MIQTKARRRRACRRPRVSATRRAARGVCAFCAPTTVFTTLLLIGLTALSAAVLAAGGSPTGAEQPAQTAPSDVQKARLPLAEIRGVAMPPARPAPPLDQQPEVRKLYEAALERYDAGELERASGRLSEALDLAQADYYELSYLMAVVKYRSGAHGQARTFAESAASLRPGAADVHYLLGMVLLRQDRPARAIVQLRAATLAAEREPDNPHVTAAWFWLGESLAKEEYWAAAVEAYARFDEAIWKTHPEHQQDDEVAAALVDRPHGMLERRLGLLRRLGRPEQAISAAAEARERRPDDPYLGRLYVRALLGAGRGEEALALCREQLEALAAPADAEPSACIDVSSPFVSLTVEAARAAGGLDEWLDELIAKVGNGQRVELAAALARRLVDAKEHPAAIRLWRAIAAHRPGDADAAWALAAAQRDGGAVEAALATLIEFSRRYPDTLEVPRQRLETWMNPRRVARTEGASTRSLHLLRVVAAMSEQDQRDFATDFVLGTAATAAEQTELAEKLFRAALEARPDFAPAHVAWGLMLLSQDRWEEARDQARAALEKAPDLAAAHFVLAVAHAGLDEPDQAEEAFRAAWKARPDDPGYALALAHHYRRRGNLLATQRYFQEALTADPTNVAALESLIDSYLGGAKIDIARAQVRQAQARDYPDDVLRRIRTMVRFARAPFEEEHLAELARQFGEFPHDVQTGLLLAAGLMGFPPRPDEVFAVLERVLVQAPENEVAQSLMVRVQMRRLEYDDAIRILEQRARRYPNRVGIQRLLADAYRCDFRVDQARNVLRRLLDRELGPEARLAYRSRLLLSHIELSDFDQALQLVEQWLAEEPQDSPWMSQKLGLLVLAGRAQEAMDLASERLELPTDEFQRRWDEFIRVVEQFQKNPDDPALRREGEALQTALEPLRRNLLERRAELIQVCMDARRFKSAEEHARRWLAAEPAEGQSARRLTYVRDTRWRLHAQNAEWLAQALIADGRSDEVLEALEGFPVDSALPELLLRRWRARALAAAGRFDGAAEELETLLGEHPSPLSSSSRTDVWQQLIQVHVQARRYDQALDCCHEWFAEFGREDPAARLLLLTWRRGVLEQAGWTDEYLEVSEQALELDPEDSGLNNDLGYTWVDAGMNVDRATRMIRKAVADDPLNAAYLDSLGWAYYKAADFARAQKYLSRAARLRGGQDPVIYDHLADAEYRLGDRAGARRHWQKALELIEEGEPQPGAPPPAELLASVRGKLAALERSEPPEPAPTAAEQTRERK